MGKMKKMRVFLTGGGLAGLLLLGGVGLGSVAAPNSWAAQAEDPRTHVTLPPDMQGKFLAMMRTFMDSLDDITNALGEGDFREVTRIAREEMGPAHNLMKKLRAAKVPENKIAEIARRIRTHMEKMVAGEGPTGPGAMHQGMGRIVREVLGGPIPGMMPGMGRGAMGGPGKGRKGGFGGFGQFLPPEMHSMGMQMHLLSAKLADRAEAAAKKSQPDAAGYKAVLSALGEVTGQCRACHSAWRVIP